LLQTYGVSVGVFGAAFGIYQAVAGERGLVQAISANEKFGSAVV